MLEKLDKRLPNTKLVVLFFSINVAAIIIVFLLKPSLPPVIPIYYGMARGLERLGPASTLAFPPLSALIIGIIASGASIIAKDDFLRKILIGINALATTLALIAVFRVASLVGNF